MKHFNFLNPLITLGAIVFLLPATWGQVFIPDTVERNMLNGLIPGIVDMNGVMDTLHPAIPTVDSLEVDLTFEGPSFEFVSLQYLDSLRHASIYCHSQGSGTSVAISISRLPDAIVFLHILDDTGPIHLPVLPQSLDTLWAEGPLINNATTLSIAGLADTLDVLWTSEVTSFTWPEESPIDQWRLYYMIQEPDGPFPPTHVEKLIVNGDYYIVDLSPIHAVELELQPDNIEGMIWPTDLQRLTVYDMASFAFLPPWPASLLELDLSYSMMACVPPLPQGLEIFHMSYSQYCMPNWPPSLTECYDWVGQQIPQNQIALCSVLNSICPGTYPGISGHVLMDVNQNGQCDPGEPPLLQASVTLSPNGNVSGCDANGYWEIGVQPGNYTITPSSNYPYIQSISPTEHTAELPNMGDADTLNDFAVTIIPNMEDLRAFLCAEPARPGFNNQVYLTCQNYGTVPMDAQLTLEFDADQTWVGSSITPTTQSGTTATWQLGTLAIGASQQISVDLNTATNVALGTPIGHTLSASPTSGDETPLDNVVVVTDSVVGSFDPNDKSLSPVAMSPEQVQSGMKPITYTIRFQNTGTYLAERVVVVDTLPEGLQPQSVEFLSSSHSCHWYVLDGVLHFIHEGINLPDSTSDEPGSHGYVQFRILPDVDLVDGETVMNIAHIVFDFNAPIVTPPATFRVDVLASVNEQAKTGVQVHPNPVRDRLWIALRRTDQAQVGYTVQDLLGRRLMTGRTSTDVPIDVSSLPSGVFVLTANNNSGTFSTRFVKQ